MSERISLSGNELHMQDGAGQAEYGTAIVIALATLLALETEQER